MFQTKTCLDFVILSLSLSLLIKLDFVPAGAVLIIEVLYVQVIELCFVTSGGIQVVIELCFVTSGGD